MDKVTWVGMDAHKKAISVAVMFAGQDAVQQWTVENTPASIRRLVKKLVRESGDAEVRSCYEAGPCGYMLKRQMEAEGGVICEVIAPSLIPFKPGDHIKTDRRDARKLLGLHRAGLLTEVHPPTPEQESVRDLCRCREDAKQDLMRARHRLSKFLLRRGIVLAGGSKPGSQAHGRWLQALRFECAADQAVFDDYMLAVTYVEERIKRLDEKMREAAQAPLFKDPVAALRCFRGIDTVTALMFVAELHGFERFRSPRALMAYLGLVPSEHSSSDSVRRGSITKSGNSHARRILIEASWHYRHRPAVGAALRRRRVEQPARVIAIADRAQHRLHRRYRRLVERGKPANKALVAVARELVGFLWATLQRHDSVT